MNKRSLPLWAAFAVLLLILVLPVFNVDASAIHSVVRVGFNSNFMPYQFLDENGAPSGLYIEIMDEAAKESGTLVEYYAYENDRECVQALEKGIVDVVLGITKRATVGRKIAITDVLSSTSLCIIASNEMAEEIKKNGSLAGMTAAVEGRHLSQAMSLQKREYALGGGNTTFLCVDTPQKVVDYLMASKVDFAVCEKNSALYLFDKHNCQSDYALVINYLTGIDYYMATREDEPALLLWLNDRISNVRITGKYSHLRDKWIVPLESYASGRIIKIASVTAATIAVVALIYVFISNRVRVILKSRINEQTRDLQCMNSRLERNLHLLEAESAIRSRIIEDSPNGMLMFEEKGDILLINRRACELLSVSQETCGAVRADQIALLKSILQQIKKTSQTPTVLACNDMGKTKFIRCIVYQMPETEKAIWLLSFEDVTKEERNKQEQIETEKNRILNAIIAGISHEIKNPLTAIKTYSSILMEQKEDSAFLDSFAHYVPIEVDRINRLVESLLNYARPAKGLKMQVHILPLLNDCVGLLATLAKKAGAEIVCDGDDSAAVMVYQDGLRQAVVNYLMNAIDSVKEKQYEDPERGRIEVNCGCNAGKCRISIFDNGIGMNEDQLQHCMEPFYTQKTKGTGLGMPIALQAIRESGGTVSVESEYGRYTRINIEFEVSG